MEIFDAISYFKGASLIRMAENLLGSDSFRDGMRVYINRHQYGNANTANLWAALSEVSGQPMNTIMHHWTSEYGYPLVHLSVDRVSNLLHVQQERFFSSPSEKETLDEKEKFWAIPLRVRHENGEFAAFLTERNQTFPLPASVASSLWLYPNAKQAGFYRAIIQDEGLIHQVRNHLDRLEPTERLGLQNDWFSLAFANRMEMSQPLLLLQTYAEVEDQYAVWVDLLANLSKLLQLWETEPHAHILHRYVRTALETALDRIGWETHPEDPDLTLTLRSLLMKSAGALGNPRVIQIARSMFKDHLEGNLIHPNQQEMVFSVVMQSGTETDYDLVEGLFERTITHEGKINLLRALAQTQNPALLDRVLELSISDKVRPQDTFYAFASTSKTSRGRAFAWEFLQIHWHRFEELFGDGQFLFPRIVSLATQFHTHEKASEVEAFFIEHPVPFELTLNQTLAEIRSRASWLQFQGPPFAHFLQTTLSNT